MQIIRKIMGLVLLQRGTSTIETQRFDFTGKVTKLQSNVNNYLFTDIRLRNRGLRSFATGWLFRTYQLPGSLSPSAVRAQPLDENSLNT